MTVGNVLSCRCGVWVDYDGCVCMIGCVLVGFSPTMQDVALCLCRVIVNYMIFKTFNNWALLSSIMYQKCVLNSWINAPRAPVAWLGNLMANEYGCQSAVVHQPIHHCCIIPCWSVLVNQKIATIHQMKRMFRNVQNSLTTNTDWSRSPVSVLNCCSSLRFVLLRSPMGQFAME